MSTPFRSFLSASFGPGLTVFTACSAYFNGPLAFSTTLGFGLTVVWGIVEIALLSYTPVASIELDSGRTLLEDDLRESSTTTAAMDNVLAFPEQSPHHRRAA